ncbi:MAG: hypothetical protein ACQ9MH_19185 [Nitrospinales bacterium]
MQHELPQFRPYGLSGEYYFSGWQTTSHRNRFKLRLGIPPYYPDNVPSLFVTSPHTLRSYRGRATINSQGTSHAYHTMSNGTDGCVKICHFDSAMWDASKTCVAVFMKGILWLEAYEMHLRTGEDIATILSSWERSQ